MAQLHGIVLSCACFMFHLHRQLTKVCCIVYLPICHLLICAAHLTLSPAARPRQKVEFSDAGPPEYGRAPRYN